MSGSEARFAGFPDRMAYVPVPAPLFGAPLRDIDALGELKLTLHVCRLLHRRRGTTRYVRRSELLADRGLLLALQTEDHAEPNRAVDVALAAAAERGTLLRLEVRDDEVEDVCLLLNTPGNHRLVEEVRRGERRLGPWAAAATPAEVVPDASRPTIFELYEQNVGLLTPLLAEELAEAEATYPEAWIEDAFREAVTANKRSWRYVKRVLDTWATRGRGTSGEARRRPDPPADWRRYREGKYGRLVGR